MPEPLSFARALGRGFAGCCPRCGKGALFHRFLKVSDHCPACGEEMAHHRADDLPAYLVILIAAHLSVLAIVAIDHVYEPPILLLLGIALPVSLAFSLGLLQPIKGAVVALQWFHGMHGFAEARQKRVDHANEKGSGR